jgi:cysteine synthase A
VGASLASAAAAAGCAAPLIILADPPGSVLARRVALGCAFSGSREAEAVRLRSDTVVEGIGCDRLTGSLLAALPHVAAAVSVSDAETVAMGRFLLAAEGLWLGSSSALNACAAVKVARSLQPGAVLATVFCDSGSRQQSSFWSSAALQSRGLQEQQLQQAAEAALLQLQAEQAAAGLQPPAAGCRAAEGRERGRDCLHFVL